MKSLRANWQAGLGFPDTLVIDGHIHFDGGFVGQAWDAVGPAADYALRVMDASGVDLACVVGGGFYGPGNDYTCGNDDLLEFCRLAPNRFIGFAHFNPNDSQTGLDTELKRTHAMGFRCIKLLNAYQDNHPGDSSQMRRIYHFAADHNMLILNHHWPSEVLDRIAREFTTVNFIAGHWYPCEVLRLPNVYCNLWGLLSLGELDWGVKKYGADKFLMGSDAFLNPITVGLGLVAQADIPDTDKRKILGTNQARLLHAVGVLPPDLHNWL
jgi:predicted TIM-barrel fold metal-dependent hydrolase